MKILFMNYSNALSTEPLYLTRALQECGIQAQVWADPRISAYDAFDMYQPDVFVTHYETMTSEIAEYLEKHRNIKLVLNVTGISDSQMQEIEKFVDSKNIEVAFVFVNSFGYKAKPKTKFKCERIFPAYDIFRQVPPPPKRLCKEAVISNQYNDHLENQLVNKEIYHVVQATNGDKDERFDIRVNATSIQELCNFFSGITLVGDTDFVTSQMWFDGMAKDIDVMVKPSDQENFGKVLKEVFSQTSSDAENVALEITKAVKSRHTPFHRAGTFCKHLKFKEGLSAVERVKSELFLS